MEEIGEGPPVVALSGKPTPMLVGHNPGKALAQLQPPLLRATVGSMSVRQQVKVGHNRRRPLQQILLGLP
jgi:hypothetical protein